MPVVNLIWRHLATVPDGLAWAWAAVRPLYVSGAAAAEGSALLAALLLPAIPPWAPRTLRAAAGDAAGERAIVTVLDSYNRSNAMNLVALSALALRLRHPAPRPAAIPPPIGRATETPSAAIPARLVQAASAPVEGPLPRLLGFADLEAPTAELVWRLDRLGEQGEHGIPASMYRHLAHWPGLLELAHALIAPLDADGRLRDLVGAARELATAAGHRVIAQLATPGPAPGASEKVVTALGTFTGGVIARMVPICALLRRAVPGAPGGPAGSSTGALPG